MTSWRGWHLQPRATKEGPKLSHSRQLGNAPHTHYAVACLIPPPQSLQHVSSDTTIWRTSCACEPGTWGPARITNDSDAIDDVQIDRAQVERLSGEI